MTFLNYIKTSKNEFNIGYLIKSKKIRKKCKRVNFVACINNIKSCPGEDAQRE